MMTTTNGSAGRFGIVGSGWRSEFFLRMARAMPDRFTVAGMVTRTARRGSEVEATWEIPTFRSVADLVVEQRPEFVVVSVPWAVTPEVTEELVRLRVPVLAETPPAPDVAGLRRLWSEVGDSNLVQVAEQYMMMPGHAAQWAVSRSGALGEISSVQVSSTHMYHAVSMMRRMLRVGSGEATVTARTVSAPLADPVSRVGWSGDATPKEIRTTQAMIDFGAGRTGLYDFTENQWFNPLRTSRIVVRGSLGELVDNRVVRLVDPHSAVESPLVRRQTGLDLNLEGFALDHISFEGAVVYRNPFPGARDRKSVV